MASTASFHFEESQESIAADSSDARDEGAEFADELDRLLSVVKKDPTARRQVGQLIARTAKRWEMPAKELLASVWEVYGKPK